MRVIRMAGLVFVISFLVPALASAAWWSQVERPANWRRADWSATGLLPPATMSDEAAIHIMAARTGGLKGAFSVHSWIVIKRRGADSYTRIEKVGWGLPVRVNAYPADARWYSNQPMILRSVTGPAAEPLIDRIEDAVRGYPHQGRGDYRIWPGPNSNSFVAHVLRQVPELDAVLPPHAVGRDWLAGGRWLEIEPGGRDVHLSAYGLAGISGGWRTGVELHLLGQTLGVDLVRPALKLPAIGRVGLSR